MIWYATIYCILTHTNQEYKRKILNYTKDTSKGFTSFLFNLFYLSNWLKMLWLGLFGLIVNRLYGLYNVKLDFFENTKLFLHKLF